MVTNMTRRLFWAICSIGAAPGDSDEVRLQKATLMVASMMFIPAGLIWGLLYLYFGETLPGLIPLSYAIVSSLSLVIFAATRHYHFFRFSQLLLILLLPFSLMLALGGFVSSSAVIVWSFLSPLGALLFADPRQAPRWFLAYLTLLVVSIYLPPLLRNGNNLPQELVRALFVLNIGAISTIAFILFAYFIGQQRRTLSLLRQEQAKSESLLLNVLPKEVAAVLKRENRLIADHFEAVSILFADVVGFTPLSAELAPAEMVNLLNEVFSYFDSLVEKYGLEKIRTIGDNYMVGSGVPRPRPDHAHALARMALDMLDYTRPDGHGSTHPAARRLQFRIGINSGPVVAGVIGRYKFHYDLWGDPVNVASRMESHGEPGKIQITRQTYELIKDDFICEPRGKVVIKGKGEMETWYLTGIRE